MHPEDVPRRPIPHVLQWLADQGFVAGCDLSRILERVPLAQYTLDMLGSDEGLDSGWWSVERDAALAELAARRLPEGVIEQDAELANDLFVARRTAIEGLAAYHVHRGLRPSAEGVGRLLLAAFSHGVLRIDEIVAEFLAVARLAPSGMPPNEGHAETRGVSRDIVGDEPYRIWPDVALMLVGVSDPGARIEILLELERTIAFRRSSQVRVIEEAIAACRSLLPPEGEIAVLWVAFDVALWATIGPRCQLLRARRDTLDWLHPRTGSSRELELHELEAAEGDTFLLLDDETWARSVQKASLRRPEPRPVAPTLCEELRRRFVERLSGTNEAQVDLTPRSLLLAEPRELANAVFAELGEPREATLVILRVPVWSAPADLSARLSRQLAGWAERQNATIELRSASIRLGGDGHPPPGRTRHLVLDLACDARLGRERAQELGDRFAAELRRRHPWLCCSWGVRVEPWRKVADPAAEQRLTAVRVIAEDTLRGRTGLVAKVKESERWGESTGIEVLVVRDDVDGADDERAAAAALERALREYDARIAKLVEVRGEYFK